MTHIPHLLIISTITLLPGCYTHDDFAVIRSTRAERQRAVCEDRGFLAKPIFTHLGPGDVIVGYECVQKTERYLCI
jgi:hypothetical protein